jgi:hypothetical protein
MSSEIIDKNKFDEQLLSKEDILLKSLYRYYNNVNMKEMLPIVTGCSHTKVSLRVLDWFVTNYAKKNHTTYPLKKNGRKVNFDVFLNYKSQLKAYNKRFFDPFCRTNKNNNKNKIAFQYDKDKQLVTTIGQLNFFRWAIRNNVIKYVKEHLKDINLDMNNNNKKNKRKKYKQKKEKKYDNSSIKHTYKKIIDFNVSKNKIKEKEGEKKNENIRSELSINATSKINKTYRITRLDFSI